MSNRATAWGWVTIVAFLFLYHWIVPPLAVDGRGSLVSRLRGDLRPGLRGRRSGRNAEDEMMKRDDKLDKKERDLS
jgi:hypothetical protein